MSEAMFANTKRFRTAVGVINAAAPDRFPLVLARLLQKLHLKERLFSEVLCMSDSISRFFRQPDRTHEKQVRPAVSAR